MKVLITGYTYSRENLFEVFDSYPEKENLYFVLPSNWTAKNGKVVFHPFTKPGFNIEHSPAFFSHSNYPIIGGLFKGWMPFFIFSLLRLSFTRGIDIVFSTGEPNQLSTLYNAVWAKLVGAKHVFNYWENIPYEKKDRSLKLLLKKCTIKANVWLSDGAICGMHKAEDILRTFSPTLPIGTFLHAGFDTEKFSPRVIPKIPRQNGRIVFLFVGAVGYRKGIHLVLEAMAQLSPKYRLHFLIVGSGDYETALQEQADRLGLKESVTFIPWLPNNELPSIYTSSDIFMYPSIPHRGWEEQFGYSIAEASLCELPVISTNTGSIYEVLADGKTGLMVQPDNIDQLRDSMEKLITNEELRTRLGKQGRMFISENFSNPIIARKIYSFFKSIITK